MIGIFDKVFQARDKVSPPTEAPLATERLVPQISQYEPLIQLQDERQLIEVLIPDENESFQTMILGIDLYHQQLNIDEFFPKIMSPDSLVGKTISLRHQNKHQMLYLTNDVIRWDSSTQSFFISLPTTVAYQARRGEERISIHQQTNKVIIKPLYGAPWYGNIINISQGGMRIIVTGDIRDNIHKNKALQNCQLELHGSNICSPGRVKSFSFFGRPYRRTEVSIAFEHMPKRQRNVLEQLISQLTLAA